MAMYYDRDGKPVEDTAAWGALFEDRAYQRVARTVLPNGILISTVWLGIDHNFSGKGPPIIFETMVFDSEDDLTDLDVCRYATEEEALFGHEVMVKDWLHVKREADDE